ncbi:ribbon-helix-helix domain-containing protein [Agrobacterium tumefaciens]|uniref:ribbon-helix-helix domain-containing protein n=1 Tax=Agrobacterium tumefaciens TaxID=358 RepID=UPI002FDA9181
MSKRPSLAESMKAVGARPTPDVAPVTVPQVATVTLSPVEAERPASSGYRAKTREGMKRLTVVVDPAEHRRVKRLSADIDRSIEDLMREALADLLQKHNA